MTIYSRSTLREGAYTRPALPHFNWNMTFDLTGNTGLTDLSLALCRLTTCNPIHYSIFSQCLEPMISPQNASDKVKFHYHGMFLPPEPGLLNRKLITKFYLFLLPSNGLGLRLHELYSACMISWVMDACRYFWIYAPK